MGAFPRNADRVEVAEPERFATAAERILRRIEDEAEVPVRAGGEARG